MEESNIVSFALWSVITAIIIGVTSLSYRAYRRRSKNETPAS
ncbi:MAG: hypothetical protein OES14_04880 [Nitrosopumilus sp.]|nr:hypothetical protein [Nitrosopumilus sp.]MDH3825106.1 hypothetical protein [Nitrosopumilus sp.]